jgi:hypothetical protein
MEENRESIEVYLSLRLTDLGKQSGRNETV